MFKNIANKQLETEDGSIVWVSRSVAVTGVVMLRTLGGELFILAAKRGPKAADFNGLWNLPCGYLDWNESGDEAVIREVFEETGFNISEAFDKYNVITKCLEQPWWVHSAPTANRQNVTLRFGVVFEIENKDDFPLLTIEYNEVVGETESPEWLKIDKINERDWAFGHDKIISEFIAFCCI